MNNEILTDRRYELDWLRVILIFTVFLHHVFMPFNGDDWHIMNNESSKLLDDVMVYFEQFRLPILFLISGAASTILLAKRTKAKFFKERMFRLLLPLLIGILFVVPPQTYFENINNYSSYFQAFPELALQFKSNHLWFIEYLIVFVLFAIPLYLFNQSDFGNNALIRLENLSENPFGLFLLVIPLLLIRIVLKRYFPEDGGGIENLSSSMYYFYFFVAGMFLISRNNIWKNIEKFKFVNLTILIIFTLIFYAYYYADVSEYISLEVRWSLWWAVTILVSWSATLTIFGYGQKYFKKSNKWLMKMNEMIYPFYIFHQTVIVIIAYYIVHWHAGIILKASVLLLTSLSVTVLICAIFIYPFNSIRFLFGLKPRQTIPVTVLPEIKQLL